MTFSALVVFKDYFPKSRRLFTLFLFWKQLFCQKFWPCKYACKSWPVWAQIVTAVVESCAVNGGLSLCTRLSKGPEQRCHWLPEKSGTLLGGAIEGENHLWISGRASNPFPFRDTTRRNRRGKISSGFLDRGTRMVNRQHIRIGGTWHTQTIMCCHIIKWHKVKGSFGLATIGLEVLW